MVEDTQASSFPPARERDRLYNSLADTQPAPWVTVPSSPTPTLMQRRQRSRLSRWLPLLMLLFAVSLAPRAEAAQRIDAETMIAALKTANPAEKAYVRYVAALVEAGYLPHRLVASTFQWARNTPYPKRVQYFKNGLITRAAKIGIRLPQEVPSTANAVVGKVVVRVLVLELPAAGVTVTIEGTERSTTTDKQGNFRFDAFPYGTYHLEASGPTAFALRPIR